jgi:hypothetical protein
MAASESTKFQVNYRMADGTLINLYATDVKELESGLADLGMLATLIKSTGADFNGGATASAVAAITNAFPGATPVAAPAGSNACRHGEMNYREGVGGKGPWKAWMCGAPKGTPKEQQCDPIWVK